MVYLHQQFYLCCMLAKPFPRHFIKNKQVSWQSKQIWIVSSIVKASINSESMHEQGREVKPIGRTIKGRDVTSKY